MKFKNKEQEKPMDIHNAVQLLKEALAADPIAMDKLIKSRVECNETLANHPTIVVMDDEKTGKPVVGVLGLLNGIFGTEEYRIAANLDEDGYLVGFEVKNIV